MLFIYIVLHKWILYPSDKRKYRIEAAFSIYDVKESFLFTRLVLTVSKRFQAMKN